MYQSNTVPIYSIYFIARLTFVVFFFNGVEFQIGLQDMSV